MLANAKFTNERFMKNLLGAILLLAFVLRLAAILLVGDSELDNEYATLIPNLLNGRGYSYYSVTQSDLVVKEYVPDPKSIMPSAFKPPVYSLMIAAFAFLFGTGAKGILIIEIFQATIGIITCWLIYDVGRMKFDKQTAFWAFLIASIYPLLAMTSAQISAVTVEVFLRCLFYWLLFKLESRPNSRTITILAGLSMGTLFIARTEMWIYLPFIVLWMIWTFKDKWLRLFAPMMIIAVFTVAPWALRNYMQFKVLTLNTSGGLNLWEGQNEQAQGIPSWYAEPRAQLADSAKIRIKELAPTKDFEVKLGEIYYDEAKKSVRAHPGRAITLALRKFVYYWGAVYPGVRLIYANADSPFYWLPWLSMLPFFIYGVFLNLRSFRQHFLFHANFLLSTITIMIFFVLPKYILFVMPWVILFAASAIKASIDWIGRKAGSSCHTT